VGCVTDGGQRAGQPRSHQSDNARARPGGDEYHARRCLCLAIHRGSTPVRSHVPFTRAARLILTARRLFALPPRQSDTTSTSTTHPPPSCHQRNNPSLNHRYKRLPAVSRRPQTVGCPVNPGRHKRQPPSGSLPQIHFRPTPTSSLTPVLPDTTPLCQTFPPPTWRLAVVCHAQSPPSQDGRGESAREGDEGRGAA
jgi:hypothetical protein